MVRFSDGILVADGDEVERTLKDLSECQGSYPNAQTRIGAGMLLISCMDQERMQLRARIRDLTEKIAKVPPGAR